MSWNPKDNIDRELTVPGEFGFKVRHFKGIPGTWSKLDGQFKQGAPFQEWWSVTLPHQCDEWDISDHESPHDRAVRVLEQFIGEAQETLTKLRELGPQ